MADISVIKIGTESYDVNDATARALANPSGGSTGNVLTKASSGNAWTAQSNITAGSATTATQIQGNAVTFKNLTITQLDTSTGTSSTTTYSVVCKS